MVKLAILILRRMLSSGQQANEGACIGIRLPEHYDEAFIRMWQFYLICSENYFRYTHDMVFQIQLARRQENVPQTRDYIANEERRILKLL